ncbi:MAG: GumC family protein [Candidatus Zhuqueibacterota bacterium]
MNPNFQVPVTDFESQLQQMVQQEKSIFYDYFRIIRNRKWTILICLVIALIPTIIWNQLSTPIYEAEAMIIYEEPKESMFALDVGQPFYNRSAIINLTEQIKSRTLATEVALSMPDDIVNTFNFPDDPPPGFTKHRYIAAILKKNLVVKSVRGGEILTLSIRTNHPESAKMAINGYIERLIDWNLKKKRAEVTSVKDFVENQLSVFENKLNKAEVALQAYKEKNAMISLSESSTQILSRMTEAEIAYNQAKAEREALEQRRNYIEKKKSEMAPTLSMPQSTRSKDLKEELAGLEEQYSSFQLQQTEADQHERLALRDKIDLTKQQLIAELSRNAQRENLLDPLSQGRSLLQESITLDVDLETYKARENGLKKILEEYELQLQSLPGQELQLAHLIREKEVNDKVYSILLEKREEARITEAAKVGDIQIIDPAERPIRPKRPDKTMNLVIGFLSGLGLGFILAFLLNSLDTSIKSQEDIERYINLPILAAIPRISQNGVLAINKTRHSKQFYSNKLLSNFENIPHFYEAYRTLQLNLAFASTDHKISSIILTSAGAGEGKSLTAINMAQMFAKTGTKTILVDCDLRRPMVHKILDLKQEPGLTNLLINKSTEWESVVQRLSNSDLSIITSGTLPPNPSEMLSSQSMKDLIEKLKNHSELLILDAPPIIAVNDSMILSKNIDGVCFVVRSEKAKRDAVQRAKSILQTQGIKIFGVILNDVNLKSQYGYYKDYYYYSHDKKKKRKA